MSLCLLKLKLKEVKTGVLVAENTDELPIGYGVFCSQYSTISFIVSNPFASCLDNCRWSIDGPATQSALVLLSVTALKLKIETILIRFVLVQITINQKKTRGRIAEL